jgi:choline-sulfatase
MRRRQFLQSMAAPAAGAAAQSRERRSDRPNFLVLMSDQHSPHVAGCYGDRVVRTPHLDALAKDGVLFESVYCQSPVCVPSRMAFMSGQQPSATRVWSNSDSLPPDVPTFAHAMGASGYETALIGRMHFQGVDQSHGFEKLLVGNITPTYPHIPQTLPKHLLVGAGGNSRAAATLAGPGRTAYEVHDDQVTAATVAYLARKGRERDRPFCAVAGFVLPHAPYICPKADWNYYHDRVILPKVPENYFATLHPAMRAWRKNRRIEDLTDAEIRRARAAYFGLVTCFDRMVGRIMTALRESGLDRDTVVIYTSDHGDMAGEHGMWWKNSFYEGSVTVPLIVNCPARFRPRRVREVASLIDIGPTMIDLAGGVALPNATGVSLAPLLRGENTNWRNEAFSEFPAVLGVAAMRMVRSGKWKLVHYEGLRPQLFDLESDPEEFRDLGESPAHAEIRGKLHARVLEGWSAENMQSELARRARDREVMRKWGEQVKPPTPHAWKAPADANIFPEER